MIEGINDSKAHYFVWLIVTLLLIGFLFTIVILGGDELAASFKVKAFKLESWMLLIGAYAIAVFPIGFAVRRKFFKFYITFPRIFHNSVREDYEAATNNPIGTFFRMIAFDIVLALNIVLIVLKLAVSVPVGMVIYPYHVISGIVFMTQKKI